MKAAPLVAAIGSRGTGKTSWIKQGLARSRPPRLLVWDPIGEYADAGTVFLDRVKLVDFVAVRPKFSAVYRPGDQLSTYADKFEWFCRLAWALADLTLVVDELADVTTPSWAPDSWSAITRKGRHKGIAAYAASQRPAEIDKTFLGNCTFIHCGRCNDRAAVTTMARHLGVSDEAIAGLRDLEYIERNLISGETRGPLKLALPT